MHGSFWIKISGPRGSLLLHQDTKQFTLSGLGKKNLNKKEEKNAFQAQKELSSDVSD
jgi:hypothetical protein